MLFPHGRWLLCPPTFFDVSYEINPWMSLERTPEPNKAALQWRKLHHTLIRLGAFVKYVQPVQGLPDLVFTANAGLVRGKKVVLASFAHDERKGEEPIFESWFEQNGYEVLKLSGGNFEGEGDALFAGSKLFAGWGFRSDKAAQEEVAKLLDVSELIPVKLADPRFYHLDTCFCPLDERRALFHRLAFTPDGVREMEKHIELIEVPEEDALKFVCNAVVLGTKLITPSGCDSTWELLKEHGFECYGVELTEFLKGGGSAKCLSLVLDRDE